MAEALEVVTSLDNVAVVGNAVEQGGRHLGIAEDLDLLGEGEMGGDDQAGTLVELADEVEEERTAGLRKRQVTELIEDDGIDLGEPPGQGAGLARGPFPTLLL